MPTPVAWGFSFPGHIATRRVPLPHRCLRRDLQDRRGEVHPSRLDDPRLVDLSLDDLVTHQREDPAADEERPRVAVPIDARSTTRIVAVAGGRASLERSQFTQQQTAIAQKKQGRRLGAELADAGLAASDDRQAEQTVQSAFP